MSDIRFNQWLHQSGTGGVSQSDGGHVGIGTTNPLIPVGAGNTHILNVGVVTCNNIAAGSSITAGTFYGSGANLTGITAGLSNIVEDTSPQLGGNLASNGNNINIADSTDGSTNRITFGSAGDLQIYHDGFNSRIAESGTGHLILTSNGNGVLIQDLSSGQNMAKFLNSGAVELYHNYSKKFETNSTGTTLFCTGNGNNEGPKVEGSSSMPAILNFQSDAGAANGDKCRFYGHQNGGSLLLQDFSAGSFQNMAKFNYGGTVELYHNGTKQCETSANGLAFPSGKGIDFSATSNASGMSNELLDDYEEGSFTLTAAPSSSGTLTLNSSYNTGVYTRVGNLVKIQAYLSFSGNNNATGYLQLSSLPFTVDSNQAQASGHVRALQVVYLNGQYAYLPDGAGYYNAQLYCNEGQTWIRIYDLNDKGRRIDTISRHFSAGADVFLNFSYLAA